LNVEHDMNIMKAPCDAGRLIESERVLRAVAEGTSGSTGDEFFQDLVRCLAQAVGFRTAFVSEFTRDRTSVSTLAFWDRDRFLDNFEYKIENTPCEPALAGDISVYPAHIQSRFPLERAWLARFDAESFLAIPVIDRQGEVLGHLAALHDQPLADPTFELSVFKIFAARAAAEIEREHAQRALRISENRFAGVLSSTMDAILTIDSARRITLFNPAAETVFRCEATWAIGQPVERLLSTRTHKALEQYLCQADTRERRQLWAPEGLIAIRADGDEFPIEATISPLAIGEESLFTIILRDVNDREQAYEDLRHLQIEHENLQELQRRDQLEGIVAEAPNMKQLLAQLQKVARTDTTVLVTGETGSGKELIAGAIHRASSRSERPLVPVNCAALPGELIESELFGHERGAFTGATNLRRGRFELAHEGTIFLDEVGELSLQAQAKLLRVLQEREFERVGGTRAIQVDVRLIAATNRNLEEMVAAGTFRADLYYRLNVFPIHVPPLRERRVDIIPLALHFLERYGRKLGRDFSGFLPLSLDRLRRYNWPGNIRELQNVIERTAILSAGPMVEVRDPLLDATPISVTEPTSASADEIMRVHIERVLSDCGWTIEGHRGAAAILGLKPSTLRHRMKLLSIVKPGVARKR